jgi:hypothetical protein
MEKKFNRFSVPLGLLDYVNPILYTVTMFELFRYWYPQMQQPYGILFLIGAGISVFFGLLIPTGKVLVGLNVIKFRMPVSLVFCVNAGILLSGQMLLQSVMVIRPSVLIFLVLVIVAVLALLYHQMKKINTIAVLTGAAGYLLTYVSLITLSARRNMVFPIILYGMAILLFIMLCGIGIKADLKNPKIHWIIEASNILCQLLVAVGTIILFHP